MYVFVVCYQIECFFLKNEAILYMINLNCKFELGHDIPCILTDMKILVVKVGGYSTVYCSCTKQLFKKNNYRYFKLNYLYTVHVS